MVPSTTNRLLITEDWRKIYQSFRNADFKSYDFETLRRTMITYLRENYPEDFNDYIDASEYIALIDLIAYLGQNLSFRIDLNARENFIETAERRESILRLARLISYNAKRNIPSSGFLKIQGISTSDNVYDSSGINLANAIVSWNDPTNNNWYQQFTAVMGSAMPGSQVVGRPYAQSTIDGIDTQQYIINSSSSDVPVYSFSKNVNGIGMSFEIVPCDFNNSTSVKEMTPRPGEQFSLIFKNDNQGTGSPNTGFFLHFRQGSMSSTSFSITNPVPNELVAVNAPNINNTDVWLWQLGADGVTPQTLWTKVDALTGNNVIYNSINESVRNIYTVLTRENDQIDLSFADGSFGNLPKGQFKLYYRQSNGLAYVIKPEQMANIQIQIPYFNKSGQSHVLTITASLEYTVANSSGAETDDDIKLKAPQVYYTQNRMITGEDYNIAPLNVGQEILKVKSINRMSSGVSKYYEMSDITGKYSKTNIFAADGILYRDTTVSQFEFQLGDRNQMMGIVKDQVSDILVSPEFKAFYFDNYPRPELISLNLSWRKASVSTNQTKGYFVRTVGNTSTPASLGYFSGTNLKYITADALVKFQVGSGIQWAKVAIVVGDGSNYNKGLLDDGTGPVTLTGNIPDGAVALEVIPKFVTVLTYTQENEMVNLMLSQRSFGLSFNQTTGAWVIVADSNLDLVNQFSLAYQGNTANNKKDASWMIAFDWNGKLYRLDRRLTNYIFESEKETSFFVDENRAQYDYTTGSLIKDQVTVLSINTTATSTLQHTQALGIDYRWQIDSSIIEEDGYQSPTKVKVSFFDSNNSGQIDNPDSFDTIVKPETVGTNGFYTNTNFVFFKTLSDGLRYKLVSNSNFVAYPTENDVQLNSLADGQLVYFYDPDVNVVKSFSTSTQEFTLAPEYYAYPGRSNLKFHYVHNASDSRRIDPGKTNLIDIYMLTKTYDTEYRNWLTSASGSAPLAPTSQSLESNFSNFLTPIKAISDEIVYHPVRYKALFGSKANTALQATFKAVRNSNRIASDFDLKTRILTAINEFFNVENWEFGQSFYFSELCTYVMNSLTPDITNFIIVPSSNYNFGSLYEITCQSNELFVSGATINDIQIIDAITATELKSTGLVVTSS